MITMILVAFAALAAYCLLVFARPHRTCRGCGGQRVIRKGSRARKCRACKGAGHKRRLGATTVHRFYQNTVRERRRQEGQR